MSGKKSRSKGQRGQNQWARYVNGEVIARAGFDGADVVSDGLGVYPPLAIWEVKLLGSFPLWLKGWQQQAKSEEADAIAFREDYGEWWVMFPAEKLDR